MISSVLLCIQFAAYPLPQSPPRAAINASLCFVDVKKDTKACIPFGDDLQFALFFDEESEMLDDLDCKRLIRTDIQSSIQGRSK